MPVVPNYSTPFDVVYRKIIIELEADSILSTLTKTKNIIIFDKKHDDPQKGAIQSNDTPEVMVALNNFRDFRWTTSTMAFTTVYSYVISAGVFNSVVLNAMNMSVIRIMANLVEVLIPLTWRGRKFVTNVRMTQGNIGLSEREENRNIAGWVTLAEFDIDMSFLKADFQLGPETLP